MNARWRESGSSRDGATRMASMSQSRELGEIDPNAKTTGIALWSPTTTTVDPGAVARTLEKDLASEGVRFCYGLPY